MLIHHGERSRTANSEFLFRGQDLEGIRLFWHGPRALERLTTPASVGILSNMQAVPLVRTRIVYSDTAFAELVLWRVPKPVSGSVHVFKCRLAYVVGGVCGLRYRNEVDKGDHRHFGSSESAYRFTPPERLLADFQRGIARWNNENRDS